MKKKMSLLIYSFMLMGISIVLSTGCSNDNNNITSVKDADGNTYHTVTIGTQVWMVENLKTTKYNDGTSIPLVTDNTAWSALTTPAYTWYNNDMSSNKATYGALYNWYVINTGKLAPTGWHVASDAEWNTLITYLGGASVAGGKLKEAGTEHWVFPNANATNNYGFRALPGGIRSANGLFNIMGISGFWWSSTVRSSTEALHEYIGNSSDTITSKAASMNMGFSVRCIKNYLPVSPVYEY